MALRCPYCEHQPGLDNSPQCPACGKAMTRRMADVQNRTSRLERKRKIAAIRRDYELKKSEMLGSGAFVPGRNPRVYFGVILVLSVIGIALFRATDTSNQRNQEPDCLRAVRHVDVLAEALGRYHFHVGAYPSAEQGLEALVRRPLNPPEGWDGPYINHLQPDPWGTPFVYHPPAQEGEMPILLSCGADGMRGTSDDIHPEPKRFEPGTEWTNGWVSAGDRLPGVRVLREAP